MALTGQDAEGALLRIFRGSNGDFTVPEPDGALMRIKTHIRRALGIQREQGAIFQLLTADCAFGGAVICPQTFAGFRLPELPASASAEQQQ